MDPGHETRANPFSLVRCERRCQRARPFEEGDQRAYAVVDIPDVDVWLTSQRLRINAAANETAKAILRGRLRPSDLPVEDNRQRLLFDLGSRLTNTVLRQIQQRLENRIELLVGAILLHIRPMALVRNATPRRQIDLLEQLNLEFDGALSERARVPRYSIRAASTRRLAA